MLGWIKPLLLHDPSVSGLQAWKEWRAAGAAPVVPAAAPGPEGGPKQPEAADVPLHIETHRDNVWLAVGSLLCVGGIGLVTAAWLGFIALEVAPASARPLGAYEAAGWAIFGVGTLALAFGIYVVLAFFRGWHLPRTAREQDERARRARRATERQVAPSVRDIPKADES